jgi:hypothetical protein
MESVARRTAQEAAETRATILREARKLFTDKGFADATLRMATRAGVTKGAPTTTSATGRELFGTVFAELELELDVAGRRRPPPPRAPRHAFAGCRAILEFGQRPDRAS